MTAISRRAALAVTSLLLLPQFATAAPPGHPVRLGILAPIAPAFDPAKYSDYRAFVEGLRELDYLPGRDIFFEFKSALGNPQVLPQLAEELVRAEVDILLALAPSPAIAAAKATNTIPIVVVGATDVVETGMVKSLAHPGGNVTGLALNAAEIAAKRVQLLREAVPGSSRIAVLWNASVPGMALGVQNIEKASPQLGVSLEAIRVSGSDDLDQGFAAIERLHPDGLVVLYGPMRGNDQPRILEFVTNNRLPTIFQPGQGVGGGGLMEFGPKYEPMYRRAAFYVDKIANGASPAALPVEEPSDFDIVINLKAAKSMGFEVPHSLLMRADRVIE